MEQKDQNGPSRFNGVLLPEIDQDRTPFEFYNMVNRLPPKQRARIMKREELIKKTQEDKDGRSNPL
jgi:hypothetical protein